MDITRPPKRIHHRSKIVALIAIILTTSACTVPSHMRVREGDDPGNIDKDVRFRTTYYFRVFDYCGAPELSEQNQNLISDQGSMFDPKPNESRQILNDSLYRFRMTGKANSLTSKVKFESGTLKSWEIDPFGAGIEVDEKNNRHYLISQEESSTAAKKIREQKEKESEAEAKFDYVETLIGLRNKLTGEEKLHYKPDEKAVESIDKAIGDAIASIGASSPGTKPSQKEAAFVFDVAHINANKLFKGIEELTTNTIREAKETLTLEEISLPDAPASKPRSQEGGLKVDEPALQLNASDQQAVDQLSKEVEWHNNLTQAASERNNQLKTLAKAVAEAKLIDTVLQDEKAKYSAIAPAKIKQSEIESSIETIQSNFLIYTQKKEFSDQLTTRITTPTPNQIISISQASAELVKQKEKLKTLISKLNDKLPAASAIPKDDFTDLNKNLNEKASAHGKSLVSTAEGAYNTAKQLADTRRGLYKKISGNIAQAENKSKELSSLAHAVRTFSAVAKTSTSGGSASTSSSKKSPELCPEGKQPQRGFQVLGPEGFKTFNPDERLIMAMYSSGKPLISTMKEVAGRTLNQKTSVSDKLLPFAKERIRILKTERAFNSYNHQEDSPAAKVIDEVKAVFEKEAK